MPAASRRPGRPRASDMERELSCKRSICREIHAQSVYRSPVQICSLIGDTNKLIRLQIDETQSASRTNCFGDLRSPTSLAPLDLAKVNSDSICAVVATLLPQLERSQFRKIGACGFRPGSRTAPASSRGYPSSPRPAKAAQRALMGIDSHFNF